MDTRRVEAFSDGVFAIAITLLMPFEVPHDGTSPNRHRFVRTRPRA